MTDRTKMELYSVFKNMSASLVMVVLSMTGFWLMQGKELITRHEAIELINTTGPYMMDQAMLRTEIAALHAQDDKITQVIDKSMNVLQGLQIQIARLNTILETKIQDLNEDENGQINP